MTIQYVIRESFIRNCPDLERFDKKWRLTTCLAFGIGVSIVTATGRLLYVAIYRIVSKSADVSRLTKGLNILEKAGGGKDLPSEFTEDTLSIRTSRK
ncbi:MAG: hypothetical protein KJ687_07060 [Proteobacteria bacterium]|nr:hypothetical protein [Pseudomonadota bacterium]